MTFVSKHSFLGTAVNSKEKGHPPEGGSANQSRRKREVKLMVLEQPCVDVINIKTRQESLLFPHRTAWNLSGKQCQ